MLRALLIDDDVRLFELLERYLSDYDVEVQHAADGFAGLEALRASSFDVVLLDYMMPGMDGLEVIRTVRPTSSVPIIMLTARGDDADRILGLELGADDYVTKPFNPRELLARIRAVHRRNMPDVDREAVRVGQLVVDEGARRAMWAAEPLDLTAVEFDILLALARRCGRVVTRDTLLSASGRSDLYVADRTVDVHISHLRKKLAEAGAGSELVKTVRGVGYVMPRTNG